MAQVTQATNSLTSPAWAGDFTSREHVLPGGAKLVAAQFSVNATVPSGTLVGRTYTERDAGTGYGPAADADDEVYLTIFDVPNVTANNDVDLYRPGGIVKENFLPVFSALSSTLKAKIRTQYQTTRGVQ